MTTLRLVGIASGDPAHLTPEARDAILTADLVLVPRKGAEKAELATLRHALLGAIGHDGAAIPFDLPARDPDAAYLDAVAEWHRAIARTWAETLARHLPAGGTAAFLVWGDPALFDSTIRIAESLREAGHALDIRVIPGLTSLQLLAAAHRIPLNEIGAPFLVTTGRRLREDGWPPGIGTIAVMLDGDCTFRTLDPDGVTIWWGAYLGMAGTLLRAGPLAATGPEILRVRAEAREARGWIMDTYLLRRD